MDEGLKITVKILVFLTLAHFLTKFNRNGKGHFLLLLILVVAALNEVICPILKAYDIPIHTTSSVYTIITSGAWISLLGTITGERRLARILLSFFAVFAGINFFLIDGLKVYNVNTMLAAAVLYSGFFVYWTYRQLQEENLAYFESDRYILSAAPLIFFIGFSVMLCFRNKHVHDLKIHGIKFFTLVNTVINLIYYGLINLAIKKDKNLPHES